MHPKLREARGQRSLFPTNDRTVEKKVEVPPTLVEALADLLLEVAGDRAHGAEVGDEPEDHA